MSTYIIAVESLIYNHARSEEYKGDVTELIISASGTRVQLHRPDKFSFYGLVKVMNCTARSYIEIRDANKHSIPGLSHDCHRGNVYLSENLFGQGFYFWKDGIDMGRLSEHNLALLIAADQRERTPGAGNICYDHNWKKYVGLTQVYDYCTLCDVKK